MRNYESVEDKLEVADRRFWGKGLRACRTSSEVVTVSSVNCDRTSSCSCTESCSCSCAGAGLSTASVASCHNIFILALTRKGEAYSLCCSAGIVSHYCTIGPAEGAVEVDGILQADGSICSPCVSLQVSCWHICRKVPEDKSLRR